MEENNEKKLTVTFTCDEDRFINLDVVGCYNAENPEADVPSKLYALCCDTQKEIINWRSKKLKK